MKCLLDSHALLWMLTDPSRLGRRAYDAVADRSNQLVVSSVSAWEIATKHRLGKLPQADVLLGAYSKHLDQFGAARLTLSEDHALLAGSMQWENRDPFDRMLAAQAMVESMAIITHDGAFKTLVGVETLW